MGTQAESRLSRKIMDQLRIKGIFCFKVHGSALMMAGLPDIIICAEGHFVGLEVKMPGQRNNTSVRQDYVHELIKSSGGFVTVVCSVQEAMGVIDTLIEMKKSLKKKIKIRNSSPDQSPA